MAQTTRRFFTLDVFTDTALGGNPLAVVLDCQGLDDARMQAIAGEFNLSETVFVFPPASAEHRASLRIFTPKKELPFAGHPTVGTAVLLATLDGVEAGKNVDLVLEEKVGLVACNVLPEGELASGRFSLPKLPAREAVKFDSELLGQALGLDESQLGLNRHGSSVCDAGVPFPVVPLADLEAMSAIEINEAALGKCMEKVALSAEVYVYTDECVEKGADYHVRMFAPAFGISEDPATGSAAAAMAAQIMACERPGDGSHTFIIEQGIEMGRPARIELAMEVSGGELVAAHIGGTAVIVSEGMLRL